MKNSWAVQGALEVGGEHVGEQVGVGGRLGGSLAQDGGTTYPQVLVARPCPDHRADPRRIGAQDRADAVDRDVVHEVPPGPGHDEVVVELERPGVLEIPVVPVAAECDGGVPLLAEGGLVPERRHGTLPGRPVCEAVGVEHRTADPAQRHGADAAERHGRLHVRLHLWCALRIGRLGDACTQVGDESGDGRRLRQCDASLVSSRHSGDASPEAARIPWYHSTPTYPERFCDV